MNLKTIEPEDFSSFQAEIEKIKSDVDRTLNLTWFYIYSRFKIDKKDFSNYSVDGSYDGGIDYCFNERNTFYIIQSKYHCKSQKENLKNITNEIQKIEKTIIGKNTNKGAEEFINGLRRALDKEDNYLEIVWLTTNEVSENTKLEAQRYLDEVIKKNGFKISAEINFIDRYALEGVIYDVKHGYVPHTGKRELSIEPDEYMIVNKDHNNIEAIVCNIKATNILSWFNSSEQIQSFLQKNVRESVGDTAINKALRSSYKKESSLFWYKHNGIILFVDWLYLDKQSLKVIIRNPQIVNGAQTITQLYKAYDENRNINNTAKILVRIYRLPYEDSETYKRSIDIISALNSQNKIKASDLRSTDPRQVMLNNRIDELGTKYQYFRKRTEHGKVSSPNNIFMAKLAYNYHFCNYKKPDEGISGGIESYFEEEKRYEEAFPEKQIKKALPNNTDHIVFNYIESWNLRFLMDRYFYYELNKAQAEFYPFVFPYVMVDIYHQLQYWKASQYSGTWRVWLEFIDKSEYRNGIIKYAKQRYKVYMKMLPKSEVDPRNFYKTSEGRKKYLKHQGNSLLFRKEISKAFKLFENRYGY
ncbi:MAG: AIPR protein [Firmicutes bacterium ADurb.Bin419]|nr:MAG: AIPR protein [Firmicutes bacterium ADurb.Bin419]